MAVSEEERGISATSRGLTPHPRFVKRCRAYEMNKVPASYEAFETEIVKWIATCVTSRTNSAHREIGLVRGNASVRQIWDQVSPGQKIVIIPDYQWGRYRVESIRFRLQAPPKATQQPTPSAPPTPAPKQYLTHQQAIEKAIREIERLEKQGSTTYQGESLRHLSCLASKLKRTDTDDRIATLAPDHQDRFDRGEIRLSDIITRLRDQFTLLTSAHEDELVLFRLFRVGGVIETTIDYVNRRYIQDQSAMNRHLVQLKDWIIARSRDPKSVYKCYNM